MGEANLKASLDIKLDLAGAIIWGMLGAQVGLKHYDLFVNFSPDNWTTWFFQDTPLKTDYNIAKLNARFNKTGTGGLNRLGRTVDMFLNLKETETGVVKLKNKVSVSS